MHQGKLSIRPLANIMQFTDFLPTRYKCLWINSSTVVPNSATTLIGEPLPFTDNLFVYFSLCGNRTWHLLYRGNIGLDVEVVTLNIIYNMYI